MISVLTPSIRREGLPIVQRALKRQTNKDFEWIVGSPFVPEVDCIWIKDDYTDGMWTLNRIYNRMIEKAKGDIIVSWQDFTYANPDTLQRFADDLEYGDISVSAVGNKYADDSWKEITWKDPREREDYGSFYEVGPHDIEWNLCALPKKLMYEIGGFDEEMDFMGFGMDGYGVNDRLDSTGHYRFFLDQSIKSFSLEHGRTKGWEEDNLIHGGYKKRKTELIDKGVWPHLEYLYKESEA